MKSWTVWSSASGPPLASNDASSVNHAQLIAEQAHRQHQQRGRFGAVGVDQRGGVTAQVRMRDGSSTGRARAGCRHVRRTSARCRARTAQTRPIVTHQRGQHQRQPVGDRGDRVVRLAQHPARREERQRPHQACDQARQRVAAQRHVQHAGDRRHERPHRADEARDDDAHAAVAAEQCFAAIEPLRVARERPAAAQLRPPAVADPVAQSVADEGAQRGA